jgi:acyl-CoA synthetase (NDP forming)
MQLLLADPHVDSLLTIFIPPLVTTASDIAAAMTDVGRTATKPIVATFIGVEGAIPMLAPIPAYRFPEAAVAAITRATRYAQWRTRPTGTTPDLHAEVAAARALITDSLGRGPGWLMPADAQRVLELMGIPPVPSRAITSAGEAVSYAEQWGYPVVLKAFGPAILHKTDAGAVKLGLATPDAVRDAHGDLVSRLGGKMSGIIIQPMAPDGVEMFLGGLQDAAFGPVVFCGSGGVLVELFGDAVCRLCPLTDRDAAEMLDEVRGVVRLRGHRGRPPADEPALRDALVRVSVLLDACPEIHELDINPVNVLSQGLAVLDVRIRVAPVPPPPRTRKVRY